MSILSTPITCRHCGKPINSGGPHLIGITKEERTARLVQSLALHLNQCQPQEMVKAVMLGAILQGIKIIGPHFLIHDEELIADLDRQRYQIHEATRRVLLPDEAIRNRVGQMNLPPDQAEAFIEVICQMRDILTEAGMHNPAPTQTT